MKQQRSWMYLNVLWCTILLGGLGEDVLLDNLNSDHGVSDLLFL